MQIKVTDLIDIIHILEYKIIENFDEIIEINTEDFYWYISEDDLFDPTKKPQEISLGQLSHDWEDLLRLKKQEEYPLSYDLKRLSAILQIIREKSKGMW